MTLKVCPGSPAKVVIIREINSSKAAWVVLDRYVHNLLFNHSWHAILAEHLSVQ